MSLFTSSTTPPLEGTFLLYRNGPDLPATMLRDYKTRIRGAPTDCENWTHCRVVPWLLGVIVAVGAPRFALSCYLLTLPSHLMTLVLLRLAFFSDTSCSTRSFGVHQALGMLRMFCTILCAIAYHIIYLGFTRGSVKRWPLCGQGQPQSCSCGGDLSECE